jgi:hypothetical protein
VNTLGKYSILTRLRQMIPRAGGNMAHVPKTPFTGNLLIDATALAALIFDLAPKAARSLKREQEGIEGVLAELPTALSQFAATIGLAADTFVQIDMATKNIGLLRALLTDAEKLVEVLRESIAFQEDAREAEFSRIAENVKRAVERKDPSVGAPFEKLLTYVAQVGVKAAATRRRNEAAEAENEAPVTGGDKPENTPG